MKAMELPFDTLALDLDGTLLGRDDNVSARNAAAVRAARAAGMEVILATGRWFELAAWVGEGLGLGGPAITCSGAQVRRLREGTDLQDIRLPAAFAAAVYAICDGTRSITWAAGDAGAALRMEGDGTGSLPPGMYRVPTLAGEGPRAPRAILVQGTDTCERILAALSEPWADEVRFDWSLSGAGKRLLTLTGALADKGRALRVACDAIGTVPARVLAFGDSDNDIELFRAAGASVAMGHAAAHLKEMATVLAPEGEPDGVALVIERLLATGRLA